jgi:hypothetical protein
MEPRRPSTSGPYDRRVPFLQPTFLAAILVFAFLALIPTRHLVQRGASAGAATAYFLTLWLLSLTILSSGGRLRILVPVVLFMALAPYFHVRDGIDRLLGRPPRPEKPRMKNVTPDEDEFRGTGATT